MRHVDGWLFKNDFKIACFGPLTHRNSFSTRVLIGSPEVGKVTVPIPLHRPVQISFGSAAFVVQA